MIAKATDVCSTKILIAESHLNSTPTKVNVAKAKILAIVDSKDTNELILFTSITTLNK